MPEQKPSKSEKPSAEPASWRPTQQQWASAIAELKRYMADVEAYRPPAPTTPEEEAMSRLD